MAAATSRTRQSVAAAKSRTRQSVAAATSRTRQSVAAATSRTRRALDGARRQLERSATYQRIARVAATARRAVTARLRIAGSYVAAFADRLEARSPAWLRPVVRVVRTVNPLHLSAFMLRKVAADKVFLGAYVVAANVFSQLVTPVMVAFGASPSHAVMARFITMPLDVIVLLGRERHLRRRTDPSTTYASALSSLLREYGSFVKEKQVASRALYRQRERARNAAAILAAPVTAR